MGGLKSQGPLYWRWDLYLIVNTCIYGLIFQKAFTVDDRIAWAHIPVPSAVLNGDSVDEWYTLNGKQGDGKEGHLNLVLAYTVSGSLHTNSRPTDLLE